MWLTSEKLTLRNQRNARLSCCIYPCRLWRFCWVALTCLSHFLQTHLWWTCLNHQIFLVSSWYFGSWVKLLGQIKSMVDVAKLLSTLMREFHFSFLILNPLHMLLENDDHRPIHSILWRNSTPIYHPWESILQSICLSLQSSLNLQNFNLSYLQAHCIVLLLHNRTGN